MQPTLDPDKKMTFAKGYYDSMYGRIESAWKWVEGGWNYTVTVPANTRATLILDTDAIQKVTLNGKKVKKAKGVSVVSNGGSGPVRLELVSGTYAFEIRE
jgi:alpha-L-rhamnosidase